MEAKKQEMNISILGQDYRLAIIAFSKDPSFQSRNIFSYCDGYAKQIVLCNPRTYPGWDEDDMITLKEYFNTMVRHEIVHAFLFESGLSQHSHSCDEWATNEEMIDWIARQGPKMATAWKLAEAIQF